MISSIWLQSIYNEHNSMVYNLALNYLHNTQDAEETTQDVFIKVHQRYENFNHSSSLKTWIYRITINHCLDVIKARKRFKRFGFLIEILPDSHFKGTVEFNHPGIELEQKEATQNIMNKIAQLPQKQQTALILKSIEGLSQKEISVIMEISEKAIESLLSRARSSLKEKLGN